MRFIEEFEKGFFEMTEYKEVMYLLEESINTYKVGAYRSAYITSYVALLKQLRNNTVKATVKQFKPSVAKKEGEPEGEYTKRVEAVRQNNISSIQDDNKWEQGINNIIGNAQQNIFKFSEQDREKFKCFRDYRNDAVHDKKNGTSAALVQVLWEFMLYIAPKLIVGGGGDSWRNKFVTIGELYTKESGIPSARLDNLIVEFLSLNGEEQVEIFIKFYNKNTRENVYSEHSSQVFNSLFQNDKEKVYGILQDELEISEVLFYIYELNDIDITRINKEPNDIEDFLRNPQNLFDRIRKSNTDKNLKIKLIRVINYLTIPYKNDPILPSTFTTFMEECIDDIIALNRISVEDIIELATDDKFINLFRNHMLEAVQKSYSYNNGYEDKTINTFSWDDIYINRYFILYCAKCFHQPLYNKDPRYNEIFERLALLMKGYEEANPDNPFYNNFEKLINDVKKDAELNSRISEKNKH